MVAKCAKRLLLYTVSFCAVSMSGAAIADDGKKYYFRQFIPGVVAKDSVVPTDPPPVHAPEEEEEEIPREEPPEVAGNTMECINGLVSQAGFSRDGRDAVRVFTAGSTQVQIPWNIYQDGDCEAFIAKAWGGGGGASPSPDAAAGGGSGFVSAAFNLVHNMLMVDVGGGGLGNGRNSLANNFQGGGSSDPTDWPNIFPGGAGGGGTGLGTGLNSHALEGYYLVAGGGGGGSLSPGYGGGSTSGNSSSNCSPLPFCGEESPAHLSNLQWDDAGVLGVAGGGGAPGGAKGRDNEGGHGGQNYVSPQSLYSTSLAASSYVAAGASDPEYVPGTGVGATAPNGHGGGGLLIIRFPGPSD